MTVAQPKYPPPPPDRDITGDAVAWACFAVVFVCGLGIGGIVFGGVL